MTPTREALRAWTVQYLARLLHLREEDIDLNTGLVDLGLDSADAVLMSGEMEDRFHIELDPTLFLEVDTVAEMIDRLTRPG